MVLNESSIIAFVLKYNFPIELIFLCEKWAGGSGCPEWVGILRKIEWERTDVQLSTGTRQV